MIKEVGNYTGGKYLHGDVGERMAVLPTLCQFAGQREFVMHIPEKKKVVVQYKEYYKQLENNVVVLEATDLRCSCGCSTQLWKLIEQ